VTLNRVQRLILAVSAVAGAAIVLVPPWDSYANHRFGFGPIWNPPACTTCRREASISTPEQSGDDETIRMLERLPMEQLDALERQATARLAAAKSETVICAQPRKIDYELLKYELFGWLSVTAVAILATSSNKTAT
jgi:hypothetical protein